MVTWKALLSKGRCPMGQGRCNGQWSSLLPREATSSAPRSCRTSSRGSAPKAETARERECLSLSLSPSAVVDIGLAGRTHGEDRIGVFGPREEMWYTQPPGRSVPSSHAPKAAESSYAGCRSGRNATSACHVSGGDGGCTVDCARWFLSRTAGREVRDEAPAECGLAAAKKVDRRSERDGRIGQWLLCCCRWRHRRHGVYRTSSWGLLGAASTTETVPEKREWLFRSHLL